MCPIFMPCFVVSHQFRQDRAHPLLIISLIRGGKIKSWASDTCINLVVTNTQRYWLRVVICKWISCFAERNGLLPLNSAFFGLCCLKKKKKITSSHSGKMQSLRVSLFPTLHQPKMPPHPLRPNPPIYMLLGKVPALPGSLRPSAMLPLPGMCTCRRLGTDSQINGSDDTSMWNPGGLQHWLIRGKFVFMIRDHICIHQEKVNFTMYPRAPAAHTHTESLSNSLNLWSFKAAPMKSRPHLGPGLKAAIFKAGSQGSKHRSSFTSCTASRSSIRTTDPCFLINRHSSEPCQAAFVFQGDAKSWFFFNYTWVCHHHPVNYLKMSLAYVFLAGNGEWVCLAIRSTVLLVDSWNHQWG